jgi:hypothetical protein
MLRELHFVSNGVLSDTFVLTVGLSERNVGVDVDAERLPGFLVKSRSTPFFNCSNKEFSNKGGDLGVGLILGVLDVLGVLGVVSALLGVNSAPPIAILLRNLRRYS